jgi:phage terminase small subunit
MATIRFKKTVRPEAKREALRLIDEYDIQDSGGLLYIRTFADAFSQELNSMDVVAADGLTFKDRFGQVKSHPLLSAIRDSRAQKMAALKSLNLDIEPLKTVGRPGG